MRIKKCITPLVLQVLGNAGHPSVAIGLGWQGDVDQVIGMTDRGPMTLADGLGHHLTDANFEDVNPPKPAKSAAVKPQAQE
jgi:hypothetical protein